MLWNLSLKISELQVVNDEIGENPILLLDDFMSELDENRRSNFIENIKDTQVIITCTDKFEINNTKVQYFKVKDGKFVWQNKTNIIYFCLPTYLVVGRRLIYERFARIVKAYCNLLNCKIIKQITKRKRLGLHS